MLWYYNTCCVNKWEDKSLLNSLMNRFPLQTSDYNFLHLCVFGFHVNIKLFLLLFHVVLHCTEIFYYLILYREAAGLFERVQARFFSLGYSAIRRRTRETHRINKGFD